ncbi:MAG: amidase [Alphaproteobacteria bacterium]
MSDLHHLSIAAAGAAIRDRQVRAAELVEASLARIAAVDGDLHAFITVTGDDARAAAAAADRDIAAGGWKGPLHGIPIALKDIYSTAGVLTTCHSRLLRDDVPAEDAETVARLKAAGAIIVGKTATHEFAFGGPSHDLPWPAARNPWNPDHIPAGSSSGSGAAVAAGLCAGAMGSDTGGSIRGPAGVCGIAGLKPSYGRVSRRGVYPLSWTLDHAGPMARTVEDCALMMQALSGYDPQDPASVDILVPDYAAARARSAKGLRVGYVRAWHDGPEVADADVCSALDRAAHLLAEQGMEVVDLDLPDIRDFHACGRLILLSEAWAIHRGTMAATPESYGEFFRDRVRLGAFISAADYVECLRMRRRLTEATVASMDVAGVDLILCANQYGPAERFDEATRTFPFFGKPYLTMPFNVTGQPALTVCAGFAANGLPIGIQIAGRSFTDPMVLAAGRAYEEARGDLGRRPPI